MLFMGDAEKQRTREWLDQGSIQQYDFVKVPHHGVYNTSMVDLFEKTKPKFAAICTSEKNPADTNTLNLLKSHNTVVFETKDGDIRLLSDGKKLRISQG